MPSTTDLWREAMITLAAVAAPFLVTALVVGLVVALVQTATQLQESVLSFVPKLAAALLVIALGGNFVVDRLARFTSYSFSLAVTAPTDHRAPGNAAP